MSTKRLPIGRRWPKIQARRAGHDPATTRVAGECSNPIELPAQSSGTTTARSQLSFSGMRLTTGLLHGPCRVAVSKDRQLFSSIFPPLKASILYRIRVKSMPLTPMT